MKYIIIEVDTNDADFNISVNDIDDESLNIIQPLIDAIKEYSKEHKWEHNYPYNRGEIDVKELYPNISEECFDIFNEYIPHNEFGFHSIESISIIEGNKKELL